MRQDIPFLIGCIDYDFIKEYLYNDAIKFVKTTIDNIFIQNKDEMINCKIFRNKIDSLYYNELWLLETEDHKHLPIFIPRINNSSPTH